ncbi:hypothetical protein IEO21_10069 [Rhodonia placenta]|uniref:Uncharacterized protein n=1 Tax=Rhodonia placenta TaxID=104341 RepID=A0A8H7TXS3_9APHY|nr:hypothetical protein IEO21_10069 [Postia placenta]
MYRTTARDCLLRASLRPWTNAPVIRRTVVPTGCSIQLFYVHLDHRGINQFE